MKTLITTPPLSKPSGIATYTKYLISKIENSDLFEIDSTAHKSVTFQITHWFHLYASYLKVARKYDIIYINTALNKRAIIRDFFFSLGARLLGKRIITHLHGGAYYLSDPPFPYNVITEFLLSTSKIVVTLGSKSKKRLTAKHNKKIHIVSNFVSDNFITERQNRLKKKSVDTFHFLYVGRFSEEKNLINLCNTFNEKHETKVKINLIGSGHLKSQLLTYKSDNILVKSAKYGDELINEYDKADFVVINSNYEGMPMTLLEGMTRGCIPVATNVGEINCYINNECGYVTSNSTLTSFDVKKIIEKYLRMETLWSDTAKKQCTSICNQREEQINNLLKSIRK